MSRHTCVERDYTGHDRILIDVLYMTWLVDPSLYPFLVMLWGLGNSMCNPGLSAFSADIAKVKFTARSFAFKMCSRTLTGLIGCSIPSKEVATRPHQCPFDAMLC